MADRLTPLLAERPWLLADGATGSNLFDRGLQVGRRARIVECRPSRAHRRSAPRLRGRRRRHHPDEQLRRHPSPAEAAQGGSRGSPSSTKRRPRWRAREADRAGRVVLVGGSMGPTGEILEPLGPLPPEAAREAFAEQAAALARGGADIIWIETMSSVEETEAAIAGRAHGGSARGRHLEFRHQRPDDDGHHAARIWPACTANITSPPAAATAARAPRNSWPAYSIWRPPRRRRRSWSPRPIAAFRSSSTVRSASAARRN